MKQGGCCLKQVSRVLTVLLACGVVTSMAAFVGNWMQIDLLHGLQTGAVGAEQARAVNDSRQQLIGLLEVLVYLPCMVLFLIWTYGVVRTAQAHASEPPRYSLAWAVGSHFIPVLNLWVPYRALRSAYDRLASDANASPATLRFRLWWFFWLTANIIGTISLYGKSSADTLDTLLAATTLDLLRNICDTSLYLTAGMVVKTMTRVVLSVLQKQRDAIRS